jgi:hypothetical protein
MPRKNKLDSSLNVIEFFFDNSDFKSFTYRKFVDIFNRNQYDWKIPSTRTAKQVLDFLIKREKIQAYKILDNYNESKILYAWKTEDEYTIMSGLKNNSYYAYYSALFLHQLTLQIPKTIYLNFEHNRTVNLDDNESSLTQEKIDNAFKGSQRKSSLSFSFNDKKVILTNGKFTNKLGVIRRINNNNNQCFEYTNLERTMIDIAVRPVYAGGVFEVLEAFRMAKERLNIEMLFSYLKELNFIYPYHQVVGFYLEKAGYGSDAFELFKREMIFNFYLTYDIRKMEYSDTWRLFYPKGI